MLSVFGVHASFSPVAFAYMMFYNMSMALRFRSASILRLSLCATLLGVVVLLSTQHVSLHSFALATYQSLANVSAMSATIQPNP